MLIKESNTKRYFDISIVLCLSRGLLLNGTVIYHLCYAYQGVQYQALLRYIDCVMLIKGSTTKCYYALSIVFCLSRGPPLKSSKIYQLCHDYQGFYY